MKWLFLIPLISLILCGSISCTKENDAVETKADSIPLFYQKLDSNALSITLPDNTIIRFDTYTVTFYYGPHPYERTNTVIETSDTNTLVSCGSSYYTAEIEADSIVNEDLYWNYDIYILYNFTLMDYISIHPKYIGIRSRKGNVTKYGWAQCGTINANGGYGFLEYAIDTSSTDLGEIRAGRKYKKP